MWQGSVATFFFVFPETNKAAYFQSLLKKIERHYEKVESNKLRDFEERKMFLNRLNCNTNDLMRYFKSLVFIIKQHRLSKYFFWTLRQKY